MILTVSNKLFSFTAAFALALTLGACNDKEYKVEYDYDIPADTSECPTGMEHRSGGTGIVDRSGGTDIVDRDGEVVMDFCYKPECPGGTYDDTVPPEMDWHQKDHHVVVAERTCIALPPP